MAKKKSKIKFLHLVFLACGLIIAGLYYSYRRFGLFRASPIQIAEINPTGVVTMGLVADPQKRRPTVPTTVTLTAGSGSESLTAVAVELTYDPSQLEITDITTTDRLPTVLESVSNENGVIRFALGVTPDSHGITGSGIIATMQVTPLVPGSLLINFGPGSIAAVIGQEDNMLSAVSSAFISSLYPGDLNGNNEVDILDYNIFVEEYGNSGEPGEFNSDFNLNGYVEPLDYNIFVENYGNTYP